MNRPCFLISLLLAFVLLCSFGGKDKGVTDADKRIAILTIGKWLLIDNYSQFTVNGKIEKHSKWNQVDSCFKDNLLMFHPRGRMYVDQGKLKCNKMAPRIDSQSTWRLDNAENMLWAENSTFTQPLYIEYLSDSLLEINEWRYFGDTAMRKLYKHIITPPRK